jgi:uncharacterized protein (UPF0212 family)
VNFLFENKGKLFIHHHEKPWNTQHNGGKRMAKCPKCGTDVSKPKKTWKMAGRPDKQGKRMQLEIGLYECPKCHATFREVLSKKKI